MSFVEQELEIIIKDAKLSWQDRNSLMMALETLTGLERALLQTQAALIESQQRQIATNDQLLAARKLMPKPTEPIWITLFSGKVEYRT